mgnify:CR=1 FL=1
MSGGKGGGSTTSVEVPEYIERAAQRNLNKAEGISQLGYVPQYGPDVAAFTPNQQAAFQNTSDAANAFGMATPTNQQDIMGGMGAPTEYANGVSGYSSQPMFQQSVDQLQAERPGQFNHMNSFFIDPFTGQAGSNVNAPVNYEDYTTSAQNSRDQAAAQRGNDLAIAQAQAGAGPQSVYNFTPQTDVVVGGTNVGGTNVGVGGQSTQYYNPDINYDNAVTPESTNEQVGTLEPNQPAVDAMASEYGVDPNFYNDPANPIYSSSDFPLGSSLSGTDYTNYSSTPSTSSNTATNGFDSTVQTGYDVGQVDPSLAAAAGYSSTAPSSPSSGGGLFGYDGVGDMFNGGGKGVEGGAYEGAGLYSAAANVATGGDGPGGDGTVICTSMHTLGLISDDVYKLDAEFGEIISEADPSLLAGYRLWATPVADYILGNSLGSKLVLSVVTPLATSWAAQMAHVMRPEEYKPNRLGKIVMFVGHPICRLAGYMSSGGGNLIKKGA